MVAQSEDPFSPGVVEAVMRHMNDDHAEDSVVICRALGGHPSATAAAMTGMDPDGIEFVAVVAGRDVPVSIPWSQPVSERAQVRAEVVAMHQRACAELGIR